MVVISHAYTAAWDPRAKDDSFAARVNQTILKSILRNEGTGTPREVRARKEASAKQDEALSTLPLPAPRWEQPPSPSSAELNKAHESSPPMGNLATCQPDVSREPSGNEAELQLPVGRFGGPQMSIGQTSANQPLTILTNQGEPRARPQTARLSNKSSKQGESNGTNRGSLTERVHFSNRGAARNGRTAPSKVTEKKEVIREAWGEMKRGAQSLAIRGSTPKGLQGTSRPASGSSGRSMLTLDLTSVRGDSAPQAYRTFRMPRSPAVQPGPAANVKTPPGKSGPHQTATVQILCLETPRTEAEPVASQPAAAGGLEANSKAAPAKETVITSQEAELQAAFREETPAEVLEARARLQLVKEDAVKYPLMARVRQSRKPAGRQPSQPGAQIIQTRNSAGQIVGEVEIPADVVSGEIRAAAVPMVVDRNGWRGARLTGPEEEKARAKMRRASLQLWRNANGGYVVPSKPIVSDYADKMRWRPEEQDVLDTKYHTHKSAFKELIEVELLYRQRMALAKRGM